MEEGIWGWHGPGGGARADAVLPARGRAQPTVPGGASAVIIEHEGLVGVAPAKRPPMDAPRAARPVGQRHEGRRRLGPGAEGEGSGVRQATSSVTRP